LGAKLAFKEEGVMVWLMKYLPQKGRV
jgi:hypothetical protein